MAEARAKQASALRDARSGGVREEYWLRIAGQMTEWIEQLERNRATHAGSGLRRPFMADTGRAGIRLPPDALPAVAHARVR